MPGYVVANVTVKDAARYAEYRALVPATVERYGGRYLARGGEVQVAEGGWAPTRLVILEFPTLDAARRWYDSEEYRPAKAIRLAAADSQVVFVAGA